MTQTHEQPELDCSPGAKMLIERMQTNPENFEYGGRLQELAATARTSPRDKKAITEAYDTYIVEPSLMVAVLEALTEQPEKEAKAYGGARAGGKNLSTALPNPYGTAPIKGEGQAISASWNDPTTYSTVVNNQRISQEMHIAEHEYHVALHHLEEKRKHLLSFPHLGNSF